MCGVIGFASERHRQDLGRVAAELLKTLEYRGYDSTGAAVQGDGESVVLTKGVGAPSVMVDQLGIVALSGSLFCGQVRWATFGAIDDANAQPHEVGCKVRLYGGHNGNVTNSDDLKAWLTSEGHEVISDNDGEMVVHTVEHFFGAELAAWGREASGDAPSRRAAMRAAIVRAAARLDGSYAAVVVDPVSRTLWAVKQGSSLYFGLGHAEEGGSFAVASSDLSSVLRLTHVLVPLAEGELVEFTAETYRVHALDGGAPRERQPARSRLRARDAALLPPFTTFMEQEIAAQEETCRRVHELLHGGSPAARALTPIVGAWDPAERREIEAALAHLRDEFDDARILGRFRELVARPAWRRLLERLPAPPAQEPSAGEASFASQEAGLLAELLARARNPEESVSVRLLDVLVEREELAELEAATRAFTGACAAAMDGGGRILVVSCGSSFHAALAGAVFFNELAGAELLPVLPGDFRGRFAASLRASDLVIAISQSGETKDVVDVLNLVIRTGLPVRRIAIVNNVSSTIAQEKCEVVIPLRCGPEIAVPATKSFMNQMAMLYGLALKLGEARGRDLSRQRQSLEGLPDLIRETLAATRDAVEEASRLLYLRPSLHILATRLLAVAREGALKVREVVLNHTEGFEGSEFKHGPNTILGVNTIFGIDDVLRLWERMAGQQRSAEPPRAQALTALYQDYPLVFVTGPDETDVGLTVSQVNTHKIRGTTCVMVAEEHPALRQAVTKPPADNPGYRSVYIPLPTTGDNLMAVFTATVVLQRLALRMSQRKQEALDRLGLAGHGVHPDVPKNVSKSITVD